VAEEVQELVAGQASLTINRTNLINPLTPNGQDSLQGTMHLLDHRLENVGEFKVREWKDALIRYSIARAAEGD